jgi:hypothetical protein
MERSMKHLSGTVLALILAFSAVPGHAKDEAKIKASIPFNFAVGNKQFKAGDYVVQRAGETGALIIRNEDGGRRRRKSLNLLTSNSQNFEVGLGMI